MNTTTLTPLETKAMTLLKEHCTQWGYAVSDDIADHEHIYINKAQASRALVSLSKKGLVIRKRGHAGSWFGSIYTIA